ncbi:MAG: lipoprotein-releasing system transmembrane subunit, LolC/LolE family, partial [Halieaceae bacterium]
MIFRYALGGRLRGFTRFVARASMLGMVLGVASLIIVLSVMNGFSS